MAKKTESKKKTKKSIEDIAVAMEKAEESTTPFLMADDEVYVVGDANETERNIHDFEIKFRLPDNGKYVMKKVEFNDIYITPRQDQKVVRALTAILPYFKKIAVDGSVENMSDEERMELFEKFDDEFYDACYEMVGTVLKIDKDLIDYMMPGSVLKATAQIIEFFPETYNEADTFFG